MDADTGLRCRLPAHGGDEHRHERGLFRRVAAPGQTTFSRVEQLVAVATSRRGGEEFMSRDHHHRRPDYIEGRQRARARKVAGAGR